jgi:GDP-L-fucose synthase
MRTLVTGGTGFLGRHLVASLRDGGHAVDAPSSAEVDLTADGSLAALDATTYDAIFHLAAWTRAGRFCQERAGEQWVVNQQLNTNVLDWWRRQQPGAKLVAFGTSASYAGEDLHREESYMAGEPPADYYAYAMSKRMLLAGLRSLGDQYGLDWLYLVPSTLYGPDYHTDGRALHFVYDIARKIVRGAELGDAVVLWGDGQERRELIHVSDAVRIIGELSGRASGEVVNLGTGTNFSIAELAQELCELAGYAFGSIRFEPSAAVGARDKLLSTERLAELLGAPPPVTPLRSGLADVVSWTRDNLDALG